MTLTGRQEQAAALIAADQLTDLQICAEVGVKSRATLQNWRGLPEFKARVDELRDAIRQAARSHGIALVEERLIAQNSRWEAMRRLVRARAEDETMTGAGHETGLLVRRFKMIGSGEAATMVEEYEFDAALVREMRELEKHAATELGQWMEKKEISGGAPITISSIRAIQPAVRPADDDT